MQKILFFSFFIFLFNFTDKADNKSVYNDVNSDNNTVNRDELINYARSFMGTPYKYGGTNPANGFDCSGFVRFVFNNFNIELPHSSRAYKNIGKELQPEEFKIGDVLVFYGYRNAQSIGHVGIICEANGMKSKFIHSSSGKTKGVIISELNSEMYSRRFYKCVDVLDVN